MKINIVGHSKMKDLQDFLKIAEKYLDSGLCVLPASRDGKMPIHSVGK